MAKSLAARLCNGLNPSVIYNSLPHINNCLPIDENLHMTNISQIFTKHSVHRDFSVSRLHKHCTLQDGMAMVQRRDAEDRYVCRAMTYEDCLQPVKWHITNDIREAFKARAFPFEFKPAGTCEGRTLSALTTSSAHDGHRAFDGCKDGAGLPSKVFLTEFASYLFRNNLHEKLGLSRKSDEPRIEILLEDGSGTIATRAGEPIGLSPNHIPTEWGFDERGTSILLEVWNLDRDTGEHKHGPVPPNPGPPSF